MKKSTIVMFVITVILFVLGIGASYYGIYSTFTKDTISTVFEMIEAIPVVRNVDIGLAGFTFVLFLAHLIVSLVNKKKVNLSISFVSLVLGSCASTSTAIGCYEAINIINKSKAFENSVSNYLILGGTVLSILAYLFMLITIIISLKDKKVEEKAVAVETSKVEENKIEEHPVEETEEVKEEPVSVVETKEEETPVETDEEVKEERVEEKKEEVVAPTETKEEKQVEETPVTEEEKNVTENDVVDSKKEENVVKLENKEEKAEEKPAKKANNKKGAKKTMATEKKETKKVAEKETKTAEKKPAAKKAATTTKVAEKPAAKKEAADKKAPSKAYHLSKREEDGKWAIKLAKGEKVIKLFNTKAEALEYANKLSDNQDATLRVHASKGKSKGKIQKQ